MESHMATDGSVPRAPQDVLRLEHFPTDGSAEWLAPKDLALASAILQTFPRGRRTAVEIGVWKGAWSLGVLENVPGSTVMGVDPYPGITGPEIRGFLEGRVSASGVGERFHLVPSLSDAAQHLHPVEPVLIHVDGEHTELGAAADLQWAGRNLATDGLVIVDDYIHVYFPGVASAMHTFLREEDFRIVLVTENKAYICRTTEHAQWHSRLEMVLSAQTSVSWLRHFGEGQTLRYVTAPDVLGCPVLLVLGEADVLPNAHHAPTPEETDPLPNAHHAIDTRRVGRKLLRRIAREVLPPLLYRAMRKTSRALRRRH